MDRIFSRDAATGVTTYWIYDEGTDTAVLRKQQDVTGLVEANRRAFTGAPHRWGDGQRVASIPMTVYWELKRRGVLDDQTALRRWLNDPDNRFFRTRPGAV
jgi:hypothetical protein